jgi:hypothetical protein
MGGLLGGGGPSDKHQKEQRRLQAAQASRLADKERRETQAEAARDRALRGRNARSAGSNDTLFGDYLGVTGGDK